MAIIVEQTGQPGQAQVSSLNFNFEHFRTPHGILQIVEFIVAIILFCIGPPIWLDIVSWLAWIVTHLLIWVYLFSLNLRYTSNPPFKVVEFYFNAGATFLYAICTLIGFIFLYWVSAIFAAINTAAYAASTFVLLKEYQAYRADLPK